jgi:hypothetical protein
VRPRTVDSHEQFDAATVANHAVGIVRMAATQRFGRHDTSLQRIGARAVSVALCARRSWRRHDVGQRSTQGQMPTRCADGAVLEGSARAGARNVDDDAITHWTERTNSEAPRGCRRLRSR